jgi:DNA-binding transcriptional MerR regulator
MTTETMDIQQLIQQSGVPRRTIYFYVQQGILPPPEGAGLAAYYTEDHLVRLRLIPVLRGQGLRLDEIRRRFESMTSEEMRLTLAGTQEPQVNHRVSVPKPPPVSSMLPVPGPRIYPYHHYPLPGGITITAPASLPAADQRRLERLLEAAAQIFAGQIVTPQSREANLPDNGKTNSDTQSQQED